MPVIGTRFDSVEAKRNESRRVQEIKINSTPKIVSAKEQEVPTLKKKAISMDFEFLTVYNPDIGNIKMTGSVIYLSDKNAAILKKWKSKKTLPEDIHIEIMNHLFRACLLKIANIAEDLQLPAPLIMPRVRPKSDQSSYIG